MLPRLLRAQFTPIMIAPVVLGAAAAWHYVGAFSLGLFVLALVGAVSLHLAANGIDDAYDYVNGTDGVAEKLFPPEAPGWKPIPRGMLTLSEAFRVSYALYGISLAIGLVLSLLVGWYALAIAVPGILLSYFYTAPPFRLDYRGLGLGELSILFSFGPIPALGTYYVMSGHLSAVPVLISIPSGILTVAILMNHDQIYFDVYSQSGKRSLVVVLGRKRAAMLSAAISVLAYATLVILVAAGTAPLYALLAFGAVPFLLKSANFRGRELSPPERGARTMAAFIQSSAFTLLLAAGVALA
jgi:1,4-dihydroxy-2-naphthoate polyprenyltransferase